MDGQSGGQMGSWADGQSRDYQNFFGWIENQIFLPMNTMARSPNLQAWVVQTLESAIHRINHSPADKCQQN